MLHLHKIIHFDINPKNIMFSTLRKKTVFIDFGLSDMIKQSCGNKTFTNFIGTAPYVSKEMLQLLSIDSTGSFVDLYYNDLIGLEKSISKFRA